MTSALLDLPRHAVVIGAMRCGTTTLHEMLPQLPGASASRIKEPDYFIEEKSFYRGADWYRGLFADPAGVCFDVSPNYAKNDVFKGVPQRLKAASPDARIIYIVREPVSRATSEYHHQRAAGVDLPAPDKLLDSDEGRHILSTSSYGKQIADFYAVFPADQILIVDMQNLTGSPQACLQEIMTFCGSTQTVPPLEALQSNDRSAVERQPSAWLALRRTRLGDRIRDAIPTAWHKPLKHAVSSVVGRKPSAEPATDFSETVLSEIRERLAPDIAEFRKLTGKSFDHWNL